MNVEEIVRALQTNGLSPEKAKRELLKLKKMKAESGGTPPFPPSGLTPPDHSQPTEKRDAPGSSGVENRGTLPGSGNKKAAGPETVAIVGMSGRYPGAADSGQYWDNLVHGRNSVREIPNSRWDADRYYDPNPSQPGKIYCKSLGVLDEIECFDPLFFNIAPSEAEVMDPQQRLILQEGYRAFEDAGYSPQSLSDKKCGVYLGIMSNEYGALLYQNAAAVTTTGNSAAIAAARLPYYLNLKGPAIALDTACSSSLVAIHLACQALLNREIDMALAGGVTAFLIPEAYIGMCAAGMLSPDGQCKAFDNSANGLVPGEGVGALILKRLRAAEADHDHIYGVIIGSGINQDGKTNGITAPSLTSQMELEREIYQKYQISPESIGYVEMHGTGTKLGDPIELEALSNVFQTMTARKQYCAIGSVKSNIGHPAAAAGVAAIQKVLLCLQHRQLVPTLHFQKPNEHFDFANSPFYVNTQSKAWPDTPGTPRRAAVSSFGFSGTNSHLVIEEYLPQPATDASVARGPVIFTLSARSAAQLREYASRLYQWINAQEDLNLSDLAYTLQAGRAALDYRLALVTDSATALSQALRGYLDNQTVPGLLIAQVKKNRTGLADTAADADTQSLLHNWLQTKNLPKIAAAWVNGSPVDWNELYGAAQPYRVSLPTYPFAKERYWISGAKPASAAGPAEGSLSAVSLHPLLQQNTSDFTEQRFTTTLSGREFFLNDHLVNRQRFLPGVAYLEMARAAVALAAGAAAEGPGAIRLKNVVWMRPITVTEQPVRVHIGLFPEETEISYEIYTEAKSSAAGPLIHCQGQALLLEEVSRPELDLKSLQRKFPQEALAAARCYEAFRAAGIDYGPSFQGITTLYAGSGEVLAQVALPAVGGNEHNQFVLHPGLMDSALQAAIGLITGPGTTAAGAAPHLPFSLEELTVFAPTVSPAWAWLRRDGGAAPDRAADIPAVEKFDLDLCDGQGRVCVRIKGFVTRRQSTERGRPASAAAATLPASLPSLSGYLMERLDSVPAAPGPQPESSGRMKAIEELLGRLLWVQLTQLGIGGEVSAESAGWRLISAVPEFYRKWLAESIRCLVRRGYLISHGERITVNESAAPDRDAAWEEWERKKGAWLEDPNLRAQVLLAEPALRALPEILTGRTAATDIIFPNSSLELVEGVYQHNVIADYFNELLAGIIETYFKERLRRDGSARVRILEIGAGTGGTSAAVFAKLRPYRGQIQEYRYTDLSKAFLLYAEKTYGADNPYLTYQIFNVEQPPAGQDLEPGGYDLVIAANVLHATKDIRRTLRNVKAVLKPNGLLLLNELAGTSLFTHLTFGLLEGWWLYEDDALRIPGCPGLAAANWQMVLEESGFGPVFFPAKNAEALGQQIVVAESDGVLPQAPEASVNQTRRPATDRPNGTVPLQAVSSGMVPNQPAVRDRGFSEELLRERSTAYLKKLVAETLKIPPHQIDAAERFEKYGIDSILVVQLTNTLSKVFAENIGSTLFFEYQTIEALTGHLLATRKEALIRLAGMEACQADEMSGGATWLPPEPGPESPKRWTRNNRRFWRSDPAPPAAAPVREVAIIGMAGRYAQAVNPEQFWDNLKNGRNCITEIPPERWDWRKYCNEAKGTEGTMYTRWGGFIADIDKFDPLFFQISPREAEHMDPQERLFLEIAYESIEDAGYTPAGLAADRQVGVFAGVMNGNYPSGVNFAAITNRVSYCLDFQGPSLTVDTACSGSLTAVHLAVESLQNGSCECAIAGGVNLIVDPIHYMKLAEMTMLSPGNQCRPFGDRADGFVDGEGVGAIVIKPLDKAVAAGDRIYGVIKGSRLNAGGRTNGYTVPNPRAQARLIRDTLQRAGVEARTVSCLEAHGTGTALGDPIEIAGLTQAFDQGIPARQYCAIGSVKSNIGHCESASGIAGLTKVLLQLEHRQLAPSLHAAVLNPRIDFGNTPFRVQQELTEWKRPVIESGGVSREYPRRAGISSFGAGGANVHLIVEEYIPSGPERPALSFGPDHPALIVLSAKNAERLRERVKRLLAWLVERRPGAANLADIAYTLQVGREAMDERLALIARSLAELEEKLRYYLEEREGIAGLYQGQIRRHKETLTVLAADEDMEQAVTAWIGKRKYGKLLDLWVKGLAVDWEKLYGENKPRRISLPAYPFARERHWLVRSQASGAAPQLPAAMLAGFQPLHPLLQENSSDFSEQRYSSTFSGEEFFLQDHRVGGRRVLPGMAYQEMARAAIVRATGAAAGQGVRFSDAAWTRPIVVERDPVRVHIRLFPEDNGVISYEIYTRDGGVNRPPVVHGQGRALLTDAVPGPPLDLKAIQAQCIRGGFSREQCHQAFLAAGIEYGPSFGGLRQVWIGTDLALAQLVLAPELTDSLDCFVLHPGMADAALQASIGFILECAAGSDAAPAVKPVLPYAIREMDILGKCTAAMWAVIRPGAGSKPGDPLSELDIDLCDAQGRVQVRIKGFATREAAGIFAAGDASRKSPEATVMLTPVWEAVPPEKGPVTPGPTERIAVIGGDETERRELQRLYPQARLLELDQRMEIEAIAAQLAAHDWIDHILWIAPCRPLEAPPADEILAGQERGVLLMFRFIKALLREGYGGRDLGWTVITARAQPIRDHDVVNPTHSGILGLAASLAKEYPNWKVRLIDLDPERQWPLEELRALPPDSSGQVWGYRDRQWYRQNLTEITDLEQPQTAYRRGGVYVVIGGAGGIGAVWSEYMIRVYQAVIVWIGRRPTDAGIRDQLERLARLGTAPLYIAADAADLDDLRRAYAEIKRQYPQIHGVVHSALVLRDKSLGNMEEADFRAGFAAKVDVSVRIAQVFQEETLDFVMFFSSLISFGGNAGQSNYAAGCVFKDVFAHTLRAQWPCAVKVMNWGYWGSTGAVASPEYRERMEQAGIGSIESVEAMAALELLLAGSYDQVALVKTLWPAPGGEERQADLAAFPVKDVAPTETQPYRLSGTAPEFMETGPADPEADEAMIADQVRAFIRARIAEALKLDQRMIENDRSFAEYGVDSIITVHLVNAINKQYGAALPNTVLFDYNNLDLLVQHITREYHSRISALCYNQLTGPAETATATPDPVKGFVPAERFKVNENRFQPKRRPVPVSGCINAAGRSREEPGDAEVRIMVQKQMPAVGNIASDSSEYSAACNLVVAGTILKTGEKVTRLQPGDEVIGFTAKPISRETSLVNIDQKRVFRKPDNLSLAEAGALAAVFIPLYDVWEQTGLRPGQKLLVLTPSVTMGLISADLARSQQLDLYVALDSEEKLAALRAKGARGLLNYTESPDSLARRILELTGGDRVDVIINYADRDLYDIRSVLAGAGRYFRYGADNLTSG